MKESGVARNRGHFRRIDVEIQFRRHCTFSILTVGLSYREAGRERSELLAGNPDNRLGRGTASQQTKDPDSNSSVARTCRYFNIDVKIQFPRYPAFRIADVPDY